MDSIVRTITTARKEIAGVLRRYRLGWLDVAPDLDAKIWQKTAPLARKVRRELFRERYPSLYERPSSRGKKG